MSGWIIKNSFATLLTTSNRIKAEKGECEFEKESIFWNNANSAVYKHINVDV